MALNETRYYHKLGEAHDHLLRCDGCKKLVPFAEMTKQGVCPNCGNTRFIEIVTLSDEEMAAIRSGAIDFPHREEFLKEFSGES